MTKGPSRRLSGYGPFGSQKSISSCELKKDINSASSNLSPHLLNRHSVNLQGKGSNIVAQPAILACANTSLDFDV